MIPFHEARSRVLGAVELLAPSQVPLEAALGATLVDPVVAGVDVPPFDSSAMDGYAVRSADLRTLPVALPVVDVSSAGRPSERPVAAGEAVRILTGAVVPGGADCVVPVELTDGGTDTVHVREGVAVGANVRRAGEAVRRGSTVIAGGTSLNAAHLGLAAGVGCASLTVRAAPRVAVLSTGDELVPAGSRELLPGEIYESNGVALAALAAAMGSQVTMRRGGDDAEQLRSLLEELASGHDVILSSGGVSMGGEYDAVRQAVSSAEVELWRIAIKPAKPMAFGHIGDAVFFGLPGNPVSAVVAFEAFVRPAIRRMRGIRPDVVPTVPGRAGEAVAVRDDGKTHFVRVRCDDSGRWVPTGDQGSHMMAGLAAADALAVLPPDVRRVEVDAELDLLPLWSS